MASLLVSTGEVSGDRVAAPLVKKSVDAGHACVGMTGEHLQRMGVVSVFEQARVSASGLTEAFRVLGPTIQCYRALRSLIRNVDGDWRVPRNSKVNQ